MKLDTSVLVAVLGFIASAVASPAPLPQEEAAAAPGCIVPAIYFTSLPKSFRLSALVPGPSTSTQQASWFVNLKPRPVSKKEVSIPVITRTKIAPPTFKLVNETLVADGFPAELSPIIAIFPPPHQPFTFGGPDAGSTPAKFGAVYDCDSTGTQIIRLVADPGRTFAVRKVAEGQQVLIKSPQSKEKVVDVKLRVDGGR